MTDTARVPRDREDRPPGGRLSQMTKVVLERVLAEEMTGHLGYDKHDPAGRGSGNSRNGTTPRTVLTDVGAELAASGAWSWSNIPMRTTSI